MSRSSSVWSLWLLRTVNAWETRQLVVFESKWGSEQRRHSICRQGLRGAQGHRLGGCLWWERRGGEDGTGFLLLWLPPSPQKPGKQCPEQRSTHVWALSLSFSVFEMQTNSLQWDRLHLRMSSLEGKNKEVTFPSSKLSNINQMQCFSCFPFSGFWPCRY